MKKIDYIALVLSFMTFLQSCDPMNDIYSDLDTGAVDQSGVIGVDLVLTDNEYKMLEKVDGAAAIFDNKSFSSEDEAKQFIPTILSRKYPYLGEKSSAKVTYDLGNKNLTLSTPFLYTVGDDGYVAVTGGTRFKNFNSDAQIINGVKFYHANPKQGDWVKITYTWSATSSLRTSDVVYLDGNWYISYVLEAADYTTMQQGFANFSTKETAKQFIPIFTKNKYPYILTEGYTMPIIYTLRLSSTNINPTVALMKYSQGQWLVNDGTQKVVMQFAVAGGVWLADNTIKYTLTSDDHRVEVSKYVTDESAKASITQYGNFDLKLFTRAMIIDALGCFLKAKFPTAAIGQRYFLTYRTFNPNASATIWLELQEDGNYAEKLD